MNKLIWFILLSLTFSQSVFAELRDPTRPPANFQAATMVTPTFVLNAILTSRDRKIAIINGLNKRIGDEILGENVTAINENTVQLDGPSGKITLFLFGQPIKRLLLIGCKRNKNVCMDVSD